MYRVQPSRRKSRQPISQPKPTQQQDDRPLIDRFGRRHSTAVLELWPPATLKVMGVREVGSEESGNEGARPQG
jgi:hypothetical protein